MKTIQIIISGKVQGVWYRKSTKTKADELGVFGTVENLLTGQVKVIAQGDQKKLDQLVAWTKEGPKFAEVDNVKINTVLKPLCYENFEIAR